MRLPDGKAQTAENLERDRIGRVQLVHELGAQPEVAGIQVSERNAEIEKQIDGVLLIEGDTNVGLAGRDTDTDPWALLGLSLLLGEGRGGKRNSGQSE